MASNDLEGKIKQAQSYFNRKEFLQFIKPICDAYEKREQIKELEKVKRIVENIITSSFTKLEEQKELVGEKEYVELELVKEIVAQERNNYLS